MPRHSRRGMSGMGATQLEPPQMVAVEAGHQEQLKMSHVLVNDNYFGVDPNCSFDSSSILVEDRVYNCDTTPQATQPLTYTIQPQFNVYRSLAESRFVFQVSLSGLEPNGVTPGLTWIYAPKPYFSALFVQDITLNINNVNCSDQHSSTAQYAHFIKTILFDANIKSPTATCVAVTNFSANAQLIPYPALTYGLGADDARTLTEGIINTDWIQGLRSLQSVHGSFLTAIDGTVNNSSLTNNSSAIEITYRPRDGIWLTPKMLPPGVVENFIIRLNSVGNVFQAANTTVTQSLNGVGSATVKWIDQVIGSNVTMNIVSAKYYERQYTPTQSALRSYQSLISIQPVYIPVVSANAFLVPVPAGQNSVSLQNVLAGRVPNIVVVGLLNQNPTTTSDGYIGPSNQLLTYSPLAPFSKIIDQQQCLQSVRLTVNGRLYPHLYSINSTVRSTQDLSQLYEMYKQCSLIRDLNGRNDGSSNVNMSQQYKMDNPLLSYGEFRANFTFFCYNVRRNGTLPNCSGDKEVGSVDILATIDAVTPIAGLSQLLVCGLNSDSLMSITDGGSTTSFVY